MPLKVIAASLMIEPMLVLAGHGEQNSRSAMSETEHPLEHLKHYSAASSTKLAEFFKNLLCIILSAHKQLAAVSAALCCTALRHARELESWTVTAVSTSMGADA